MKPGFIQHIDERLAELGLSPRAASLKVGTNPDLFRNVMRFGDEANPKQGTLLQLAKGLDWTVDQLVEYQSGSLPKATEVRPANVPPILVGELPRDVPVHGTAAGAALSHGAFIISSDPIDSVRRPPGLLRARDVYALYVEGDSMIPRFEPGELVYVNPNRPIAIGDYVVIQEPGKAEEEYTGFIKRLVRRGAEYIETSQFNPPASVKFKNSKGLRMHRVMTSTDLYGV